MVAPFCQASIGSPALRQACSRNFTRSQLCSIETCGSSRPRSAFMVMSKPWRPITMSSAEIACGGDRILSSTVEIARFFQLHRRKSHVLESGGPRRFCDGAINSAHWQDVTYASPQSAIQIERSEAPRSSAKCAVGGSRESSRLFERRQNGFVRQTQQLSSLVSREFSGENPAGSVVGGLGGGSDIAVALGRNRFSTPAQNEGTPPALRNPLVDLRPEGHKVVDR